MSIPLRKTIISDIILYIISHRVQVPAEDGLGGEFVLLENGLWSQKTSSGWSWTLRDTVYVHPLWIRPRM